MDKSYVKIMICKKQKSSRAKQQQQQQQLDDHNKCPMHDCLGTVDKQKSSEREALASTLNVFLKAPRHSKGPYMQVRKKKRPSYVK